MLDMTLSAYKSIECGSTRRISKETAEQLSCLFDVPVTDFLDEYGAFLYDGQASRIRAYREKLGMSRSEYAAQLGISAVQLERWENEKTVLSHKCWERYFRGSCC